MFNFVVMKDTRTSTARLAEIRSRVESLIERNRKGVGTGKELSTIEEELFAGVLDLGKLLLEDRIIAERDELEDTGYRISGKKNKTNGRKNSEIG